MDTLLRCATRRLHMDWGYDVVYKSLHECSPMHYASCVNGTDRSCQEVMQQSSFVSFCAPLRDLPVFDWIPQNQSQKAMLELQQAQHKQQQQQTEHHNVPSSSSSVAPLVAPLHAVTVLRHPVDRVWSMYRFKTKFCYNCLPLKQVYEIIANGTTAQHFGTSSHHHGSHSSRGHSKQHNQFADMCSTQLQNHMTRNLILRHGNNNDDDYDQLLLNKGGTMLDNDGNNNSTTQTQVQEKTDALVQQAIQDMQSFFTIVGLTDDLPGTRQMVEQVFPWMAERIPGSSTTCSLPHANPSPQNNRCGADGISHMELPPYPTAEDAELIRQYNQYDLQVYHAAQRLHRLQKVALGLNDKQKEVEQEEKLEEKERLEEDKKDEIQNEKIP